MQLKHTLALAASASAAMHDVMVGQGGLMYQPMSVTAAMGDIIRFTWATSVPHNVVSGDFDSPCESNGMIASPVQMGGSQSFFVMVNSTDPMYIYCSVGDHCQDGMVMAINPSMDMPVSMYASAAAETEESEEPEEVPAGGILASMNAMPFGAAAASMSMSASVSASASMSMASMSMSMTSSMPMTTTMSNEEDSEETESAGMSMPAEEDAAPRVTGVPAALGMAAAGALGLAAMAL